MKKFPLHLLVLSFLFAVFFPVSSFAESGRSVTILYTGAVKGNFEPCPT
jgi:hypothetical protein